VGKGVFAIQSVRRGTADFGSVSMTVYRGISNLLRDLPCPYNLMIIYANCGADEDPNNYDFIDVLRGIQRNGRTQANVVNGIAGDNATDVGGDIIVEIAAQFLSYTEIKPLTPTEVAISAIAAHVVNDIAICDLTADCGDCGDTQGCETIILVTDGIVGSASADAAIYRSTDGGDTWTLIANPFTDTDDILVSVACSGSVSVVLNGASTSYAYSNDGGVTFTEVTGLAQIPADVFILGPTKIWIVGAAGYIWRSSTLGASVVVQDAGVMTAQDLNSVSFANSQLGYVAGAANAFGYTENGGTNWTARTGPAPATILNVVKAAPNTEAVFVGDENGVIYRSKDKGVTWATVRAADATVSGGITDIAIPVENVNDITVSALNSTGAGTIYHSKDGGQTWEAVASPALAAGSQGINALTICQPNRLWGVGDDGLVFKLKGEDYSDSDPG
jgi:photosystem II stability/assembly factor-like uncharacterized protein